MAILAAITFPSLALISQFPSERTLTNAPNRPLIATIFLSKVMGICLVGSLFIIGFLSDIKWVLGIDRFIGVKISYLIPLLLIGIFFYLRPHRISSTFFVFKRMIYAPIRTIGLAALVLCLSVIVILILRSGNYFTLPNLFYEENLRSMLESVLLVRPRTKEFLIGYPFLILSILLIDNKLTRSWLWFFNVLGAIALISVINSFCHTHTPLEISIYRTTLGLLLGIAFAGLYWAISRVMFIVLNRITRN